MRQKLLSTLAYSTRKSARTESSFHRDDIYRELPSFGSFNLCSSFLNNIKRNGNHENSKSKKMELLKSRKSSKYKIRTTIGIIRVSRFMSTPPTIQNDIWGNISNETFFGDFQTLCSKINFKINKVWSTIEQSQLLFYLTFFWMFI